MIIEDFETSPVTSTTLLLSCLFLNANLNGFLSTEIGEY